MEILFYLSGFLFLFYEGFVLSNIKTFYSTIKFDKDVKTFLGCFNILYFIWAFVGLFTFQWYLFLILFALSFLQKTENIYILFVDSFLSFCIILFIVLNKYHFNLDLLSYLF